MLYLWLLKLSHTADGDDTEDTVTDNVAGNLSWMVTKNNNHKQQQQQNNTLTNSKCIILL